MTGKFWGLEEAPAVREATERPRKNTIERFNDELSVLERPLEGDVEYYDETPPPARLRKVVAFVLAAGLTAPDRSSSCATFPAGKRSRSHRRRQLRLRRRCGSAVADRRLRRPLPRRRPFPLRPIARLLRRSRRRTRRRRPRPRGRRQGARGDSAADDAADDAPAARQTASVKPTHGSRHSRHGKSGGRHHGHHQSH